MTTGVLQGNSYLAPALVGDREGGRQQHWPSPSRRVPKCPYKSVCTMSAPRCHCPLNRSLSLSLSLCVWRERERMCVWRERERERERQTDKQTECVEREGGGERESLCPCACVRGGEKGGHLRRQKKMMPKRAGRWQLHQCADNMRPVSLNTCLSHLEVQSSVWEMMGGFSIKSGTPCSQLLEFCCDQTE
jgi:hypothetical protein